MRNPRRGMCVAAVAAAASVAWMLACAPDLPEGHYRSAEDAANALADALANHEPGALSALLGDGWRELIPTDGLEDADVQRYLEAWKTRHALSADGDGRTWISVGEQGWTLPIPLLHSEESGWSFDVAAGAEEIRTRRIGRNELDAIQAVLAYVDAQREYALRDRNGDGVLEYAQRIVSTPGEQDGLYWAHLEGEEESPLGPLFSDDEPGSGYHGYHFRILKAQGGHAAGGAYDYEVAGRMIGGFALVAWPVRYDDTGVMTFSVNHEGVVYQADLGRETDSAAREVARFDPGPEWSRVEAVE